MTILKDHGLEGHDPLCPRAEIEAAWNGATCQCAVIRMLREVPGVDHHRISVREALEELERGNRG